MTDGKRVLLVEDDKFLRRACEAGLKQRGFTVKTAADGEEALTLAMSQPFDIILLDLLMPKKPGIEVLVTLKANEATARVPVLILSNSSRDEDKQKAVDLGADGYYVKANLSLQALGDEVARLVARS